MSFHIRVGLAPPFLFAKALCVCVRDMLKITHSSVDTFLTRMLFGMAYISST